MSFVIEFNWLKKERGHENEHERESDRESVCENAGQSDVDYLEVLNKYLIVGEVRGHGECVSEIFGVEGLDNQHSDSWEWTEPRMNIYIYR